MGGWYSDLVALGRPTPTLALVQFKSVHLESCHSSISPSRVLISAPVILYIGFNISVSTCVTVDLFIYESACISVTGASIT